MKRTRPPAASAAARSEATLRDFALGYPEAYEEFPWGERALKVNKKIFLFLMASAEGLGLSVKLPLSNREALLLPFTEPTHYGMGKHGWVSARFDVDEEPPLGILRAWIDESYRAIAPKRLVAALSAEEPPSRKTGRKATRRVTRKKA